jgi:hypothetical protein
VLLAACSSSPAAPAGGSAPATAAGATQAAATPAGGGGGGASNICQLISAAEIGQIVGKTVATTEPGKNDCTWTLNDKSDPPIPIGGAVTVRTEGNASLAGPKIAFPGGEDISGIGEQAYWTDGFSVLYFVKGGASYAVQLVLFNKADPRKDYATKIAQLVLTKL